MNVVPFIGSVAMLNSTSMVDLRASFLLIANGVYHSWWFITLFSILLVSFLIYGFRKYSTITNSKIKNYLEIENSNELYSLYFLFIGITIPIIEYVIEYFTLRNDEVLEFNIFIGLILVGIYFLSQRFKIVRNHLEQLALILFFIYYGITIYRILQSPEFISPYFDLIILYILAYTVLKNNIHYWFFIVSNLILFIFFIVQTLIPNIYGITILYTTFLISVLSHVRYEISLKVRQNFLFADNIVNKGTSLVVVVNKLGEVIYCSQNVKQILGYEVEEVKGLNFWKLTQDEEFSPLNYEINENLYTRKLKCKDNTYKYIQWKDSIYSKGVYIGIGQDVTKQTETQNHYKTLIESASDIIYETDRNGYLIYLNPFSKKLLNYRDKDILGKHFLNFIREDYVSKVLSFYKKHYSKTEEIPAIEFPIRKKDGTELWISQKISLTHDSKGNVTGFGAIARDITLLKKIEIEQHYRHAKTEVYNKTINNLVTKQYTVGDSFENIVKHILKETSQGSKINRISFWSYNGDNLHCQSLYSLDKNDFEHDDTIYKSDYPTYFDTLLKDKIIVASDVYHDVATKELATKGYFSSNNIKSLLDVPVMSNGELNSILCFETTTEPRKWDNDDINFARSVSDVISLTIESNKRLETEKKLEEKTKILAAIASTTEILLKKSNINEAFEEIFKTTLSNLGKAANVDRIYYFENDSLQSIVSLKHEWLKEGIASIKEDVTLLDIPHKTLSSMMEILLKNKIVNQLIDEVEGEELRKTLKQQEVLSIVVFPIFVKNSLFGFIGFDDCTNGRKWADDELDVMQILSSNIAASIERINSEKLIQESEEKFKLLADNIPGTVYLSKFDPNWTKVYLNDEIEKLTGYTKAEFIKGEINILDLVHPDDKRDLLDSTILSIQKNEPFHIMYRLKRKSGEYIWIEEFGDSIVKDGKVAYIEGILIDITEKRAIESEKKARELAEASNKAKSEFLANMSHEIRTPLNAIIGFTDILTETHLDKNQLEYLATVHKSAKILLDVVNDILDFSKIETGKLELDIRRVNLYEIAHQVLDIIRFDSVQKNIDLRFNIGIGVPKYIETDSLRVKQILLNLLSNAVKFTSKGTVELRLDLIDKTEDKAQIRVSVIDSGIGIKKINQEKIFEPFSQEDNSTTRKYGGTGLGLAISNKILNLMGSSLVLMSDFRKGSTFYFDLNVVYFSEEEGLNTIDIKDIEVKYEDLSFQFKKNIFEMEKKILVVEDNKINMLLARTLIKKLMPKATIIEAPNGKIAIERFNEFNPDLILLDIQMPVLNGYETAVEIRQLNWDIPIIALTAGTVKGEREKCIDAGMNDYISKPIDKDVFQSLLLKWLK
ncbi:PAS domain S-box protein [Flavobacterium luminosum]|uniref:histidine kinase n=1 Tax=Flavobacterium luminosum TaxID=2949086 RepID=A0ABT0TMR7_9FLAO|nr:PAS domain S-box protein [Flavobacterium sp. HXWNR70]MCL9808777.1 PAS domain S-box protein [Flavobacterium sp. HXWNR70]